MVRDDTALKIFSIRPRGMREAIALALHDEDQVLKIVVQRSCPAICSWQVVRSDTVPMN